MQSYFGRLSKRSRREMRDCSSFFLEAYKKGGTICAGLQCTAYCQREKGRQGEGKEERAVPWSFSSHFSLRPSQPLPAPPVLAHRMELLPAPEQVASPRRPAPTTICSAAHPNWCPCPAALPRLPTDLLAPTAHRCPRTPTMRITLQLNITNRERIYQSPRWRPQASELIMSDSNAYIPYNIILLSFTHIS